MKGVHHLHHVAVSRVGVGQGGSQRSCHLRGFGGSALGEQLSHSGVSLLQGINIDGYAKRGDISGTGTVPT